MLQYTRAANETERECFLVSNRTPSTLHMGLLLYAQGAPTGGKVDKGKNGKRGVVGTATCTVYPT